MDDVTRAEDDQRVAVSPRARGKLQADRPARAWPVIDDDGLAEALRELGRDQPGDDVKTSAAPYVLVIFPGLPATSVGEFVAYAKLNPGKLNYISSGHGTLQHLATELFAVTVGVRLVHVPYKGVAVGFPDLLAGRVHMIAASITSLAPLIRSKGVRPLGVTSTRRMALLPEVPTMVEAGIPVTVTQWHGLLAPAGTPPPVLERLHLGITKVLQEPEVASRLTADATEIVGSSPREFAVYLKAEREQWAKVIQQAGIRAE